MNLFIHSIINLFILFLCVGGLYLALFYYKKSIKKSARNLEIIETLRIDSKNMLCLVRFRNKEILLALPAGATKLFCTELESDEPLERNKK